MTSQINYNFSTSYESRKALHFLAPKDEKELSFKHVLIPKLGVGFMKALFGTCRNLVIGFDENVESRQQRGVGTVSCFWHCNILLVTANFAGYPVRVLISEHSDGELIAQACLRIGSSTIRGSTTRGGARALVKMRRCLSDGDDLVITPDGPKGPAHIFQAGAIYLAAKTGTAIVPVGAYGDNLIKINSWDKFRVPKPFSNNVISWGEAVDIPEDAMDNLEEWQRLLQDKMQIEEDKCKKYLNRTLIAIPRGGWTYRRRR